MSFTPLTEEYDFEYNSNNMNNSTVEINEYIHSLPLDTININVSGRNLRGLPDLSRFTQLQELQQQFYHLTPSQQQKCLHEFQHLVKNYQHEPV